MSTEIDKVTPLIFEGEEVVSHLQRIEEFFDTLTDDLTEVKDYMLAVLEQVEENESASMERLIPILSNIIILLQQVCPPEEDEEEENGGPESMTPGGVDLINIYEQPRASSALQDKRNQAKLKKQERAEEIKLKVEEKKAELEVIRQNNEKFISKKKQFEVHVK